MQFSIQHLRKMAHLDHKISDQAIIQAITSLGFEVEAVQKMPYIEGVKWGKVLQTYPNPNGEKLTVCEIAFDDKKRIIQTTAQNVAPHDIIIAFVPGSKREQTVFASKQLKNIVSEGMLTSVDEFGLDKTLLFAHASGINTYNDVADLKMDPIEFLGLNDTMIEVAILPNRVDVNSYHSMALELSAFFNTKVDLLSANNGKITRSHVDKNIISLISKQPFITTFAEKILLVKHGFAVHDEFVNLQNLTLIITGQPIYLLDKAKVAGTIKCQQKTDKITLNWNNDVINLQHHYVMYDKKNVVAIPGVGSLKEFAPCQTTKQVIILIINLPNVDIKENIKLTKINTLFAIQSSKMEHARLINRALYYLFSKLSDLKIDQYLQNYTRCEVTYKKATIDKVAGFALTQSSKYKVVQQSLRHLGFQITLQKFLAPAYRNDIQTFQDICEEIFRFYNYNDFPLHPPLLHSTQINELTDIKEQIKSQGFSEVNTYLLTSAEQNQCNPFNFKSLKLQTSISNLRSEIRNSILISLQEIVIHHFKQKIPRFNFFEIGQIHDGIKVCGLVTTCDSQNWQTHFNNLKQILMNVWGDIFVFKPLTNHAKIHTSFWHPYLSAKIYVKNKLVGYIGKLNPLFFDYDVMFVELQISQLEKPQFTLEFYDEKPLKSRDLNLVIEKYQSVDDKLHEIKKLAGIQDIYIVDRFSMENERQKITCRIFGTEAAIKIFDQKFN